MKQPVKQGRIIRSKSLFVFKATGTAQDKNRTGSTTYLNTTHPTTTTGC